MHRPPAPATITLLLTGSATVRCVADSTTVPIAAIAVSRMIHRVKVTECQPLIEVEIPML